MSGRRRYASLIEVEAVWIALIVFGFFFALSVVLILRFPDQVRDLLGRTESVEVTPTRIAWRTYEQVVRTKEHRTPDRDVAEKTLARLSTGRILWVDDTPGSILLEARTLRARGIDVDVVASNDEVVSYVDTDAYDLILSDIGRRPPETATAGLELPARLIAMGRSVPVAFYTGHVDSPLTSTGQPVFDSPTALFAFIADYLD